VNGAAYDHFMARLGERNDWLFEQFGRPLMALHRNKWVGISLDGHTVVRDTSGEAGWAAKEQFGEGNYTVHKLSDTPREIYS
jgi:hypothetical protein